jgi:hypothetical protein
LERLETRLTPAASVSLVAGNLRVIGDNAANVIALGESGGMVGITVITAGSPVANFGPYKVTGSIYIDGSNGDDTINISVSKSLGGPVGLAGGLGNDVFNFTAVNPGAAIQGILRMDGNIGDDVVNLANGANRFTATDVYISAVTGVDAVSLTNVDLQGNFIATGANSVFVGTNGGRALSARATVAGNAIINNAAETPPGQFVMSAGSTLGGLTYVGGGGADAVTIAPIAGTTNFAGEVFGTTALILGGGDNGVTLFNAALDGAVTITALGGNDIVAFDQNTIVPGNANLVLGDGNNSLSSTAGVTFYGNLAVTLGNGDDSIGTSAAPFTGTIAGTLQISAGNGANVTNYNGILSGNFGYTGGGGTDDVTVTGAFSGRMTVALNAGNDTFTFGSAATRFDGGGLLDFGTGDDSFNSPGAIDWPITIIGL